MNKPLDRTVCRNRIGAAWLRRVTSMALIGGLLMTPTLLHVAMAQSSTAPVQQSSAPTAASPTPTTTPDSATPNGSAAEPAETPVSTPDSAIPNTAAAKPTEQRPGGETIDGALLPHDLSPWGMFLNADIVVKAVIIGLAFASLVTWTVFIAKSLELGSARGHAHRALKILAGSSTLAEAAEQLRDGKDAASRLMQAATQEIRLSADLQGEGLKERIALLLQRIELANSRKISRGTGVLATIGSTAPFVGLFGTVWGIMASFIGIARSQATNLAAVAPGIAEALLTTAVGLAAAVPAVLIYNAFTRSIAGYRVLLAEVSNAAACLLSLEIERLQVEGMQTARGEGLKEARGGL